MHGLKRVSPIVSLLFEENTNKIIGACMSVHKGLDFSFLESIYHEALEKEFKIQAVKLNSKRKLQVNYIGAPLQKYFIADLLIKIN